MQNHEASVNRYSGVLLQGGEVELVFFAPDPSEDIEIIELFPYHVFMPMFCPGHCGSGYLDVERAGSDRVGRAQHEEPQVRQCADPEQLFILYVQSHLAAECIELGIAQYG